MGRATKACDLVPEQKKRYLATFRLGITTDTQDCTGTVLERREVRVSREELIACQYTLEEMRALIGADSLGFLSLEDLHRIAPDAACGFCDGCFTGAYPIAT